MITHEFQTDIDKFMKVETDAVKLMLQTHREIPPHLSILYHSKEGIKPIQLPVPGYCMDSEVGKQYLLNNVIPVIIDTFTASKRDILCLAWITEAWVWAADNEGYRDPDEYMKTHSAEDIKKHGKKHDAVLISFETAFDCTPVLLKRDGSLLHFEDGPVKATGRFTRLFRKDIRENKN